MSEKRFVGAGKFAWHELSTKDVDAAVDYYGRLFGWTFRDTYRGLEGLCRTFSAGDRDLGAIVGPDEAFGEAPVWIPYITVEDAERGAEDAGRLEGSVLQPPTAVTGLGTCSFITDPAGAIAVLLSGGDPEEELPAGPPRPGTIMWNDCISRDPVKSGKFYCALCGWQLFTIEMPEEGTYYLLRRGEVNEGGIIGRPEDVDGPSLWLPYVAVEEIDESCEKAASLGGTIHVPPADLHGAGRYAVTGDPAGAKVALFQPNRS